jgi:NTE family protein
MTANSLPNVTTPPASRDDRFQVGDCHDTAVVISGAGARGAYEAGVLAEVLPALFPDGLSSTLLLGTSAGAINASLWGARARRGVDLRTVGESVCKVWEEADQSSVFAPVAQSIARHLFERLSPFKRSTGFPALLDTAPLFDFAKEVLDVAQLAQNLEDGAVGGVGVVATSCPLDGSSGRSRLFYDGKSLSAPEPDPTSSIDYVHTPIQHAHVLASAAIPVAFPGVAINTPPSHAGYYVDGGVRLNTPIKPALGFGAERIVVVSSHATSYPAPKGLPMERPDIVDTAAQSLHAVMADGMIEDLRALRRINDLVRQAAQQNLILTKKKNAAHYKDIALLEVSPAPGTLAGLAVDRIRQLRPLLDKKSRTLWLMHWALTGVGDGAGNNELISYLLFDPAYARAQIAAGRADGLAAVKRYS